MIEILIYKYTNKINGKIYIGLTTREIKERHREHVSDINDGTHFHNALKKYGVECFSLEIIDNADSHGELKSKEQYWIRFYHSYGDKTRGYNLTLGGDGALGAVLSDETKRKLSEGKKGNKSTLFGKKGKYSLHFNMPHTEETKRKMRVAWEKRGPTSEETKQKRSASLKGKYTGDKNSMHGKTGVKNHASRELFCITTGEVFSYMKQATEKYKVDRSALSACCRGRVKSAGKHPITGEKMVWKYYKHIKVVMVSSD